MRNMFTCPRREENFRPIEEDKDYWRDGNCSYCGSISPDEALRLIEEGSSVTPTDKNYKIYIDGEKSFYFQHLDTEQKKKFIELYNSHEMRLGYPGYFYRLPYFMKYENV